MVLLAVMCGLALWWDSSARAGANAELYTGPLPRHCPSSLAGVRSQRLWRWPRLSLRLRPGDHAQALSSTGNFFDRIVDPVASDIASLARAPQPSRLRGERATASHHRRQRPPGGLGPLLGREGRDDNSDPGWIHPGRDISRLPKFYQPAGFSIRHDRLGPRPGGFFEP